MDGAWGNVTWFLSPAPCFRDAKKIILSHIFLVSCLQMQSGIYDLVKKKPLMLLASRQTATEDIGITQSAQVYSRRHCHVSPTQSVIAGFQFHYWAFSG